MLVNPDDDDDADDIRAIDGVFGPCFKYACRRLVVEVVVGVQERVYIINAILSTKSFVMRFPRPPNSEFEPEAVNENNKVLFSELASDDSTVQGDWILVPFFHFPVLLVASTRRRSSDQRVVIDDGVEGFKHVRVGPQPQSKQRPGYSIHRP